MDRALLSSVSAKVMRRRGVSNDRRLRGDEWPLLKVVSGLSVVVATVVDEVSMVFGSAAASPLRLFRAYLGLRGRCGFAAARTRYALSQRCARPETSPRSHASQVCGRKRPVFGSLDSKKTRRQPPALLRTCVRIPPSLMRPARRVDASLRPPPASLAPGSYSAQAVLLSVSLPRNPPRRRSEATELFRRRT